jgi:hypothetical protein
MAVGQSRVIASLENPQPSGNGGRWQFRIGQPLPHFRSNSKENEEEHQVNESDKNPFTKKEK